MTNVTAVKPCTHARTYHYIEGEGYCEKPETANGCPMHGGEEPPDPKRAFRFCRIFPKSAVVPSDAALIALGLAMEDANNAPTGDSQLPGGFTYLGQFIDHDITADKTEGLPAGTVDPQDIEQGRSPSLDLDSVYGGGPDGSPKLYEDDKIHLRIGHTTGRPDFGVTDSFLNDLPRDPMGKAIIGDHRNDENLAVAQIHLAFLKFHNKVADQVIAKGVADPFMETRKIVTQHYQSIVLHYFVPWLADGNVCEDVRKNGRKFFIPKGLSKGKFPCMPIEFSVGAYRFGHSLVRNQYEWNRVFNSSSGIPASLNLLFEFSKLSGNLGGSPTLPSDWIVDWTRLFDFSDNPGVSNHPQSNKTRLIDTRLALKLGDLPEFQADPEPHKRALAVRNLLRGRLVGLPTGQEVAAAIGVTPLTPEQLTAGPHGDILRANGLQTDTPLFYYVLREAMVQQGGQRLGQVGSRILVETFHGLIECSQYSILKEKNWKPSLHPRNAMYYTMSDMLTFVDELNPIG